MRLFDSLIDNIDRRPPNILIDESKAKLYMIDHTQAFRERIDWDREKYGDEAVFVDPDR